LFVVRVRVALRESGLSFPIDTKSNKGEREVDRPFKMLLATLVLGVGIGAAGGAYAAPEAQKNKCWGQVTKQFAATGTMGQHSSSPPGFEPGEGREGVGNVSKEHDPLSQGGQGEHAIVVGAMMGFTCDDPTVP
jgi:hypothetical protein